MSNYYSRATARESLKCSEERAGKLINLLSASSTNHGFKAEWYPIDRRFYLFAEENACPEELSKEFVLALGDLLRQLKKDYLQIGVACYGDKLREDSCGGYYVRIYSNGDMEFAETHWARENEN